MAIQRNIHYLSFKRRSCIFDSSTEGEFNLEALKVRPWWIALIQKGPFRSHQANYWTSSHQRHHRWIFKFGGKKSGQSDKKIVTCKANRDENKKNRTWERRKLKIAKRLSCWEKKRTKDRLFKRMIIHHTVLLYFDVSEATWPGQDSNPFQQQQEFPRDPPNPKCLNNITDAQTTERQNKLGRKKNHLSTLMMVSSFQRKTKDA